jgi:septum formation protein
LSCEFKIVLASTSPRRIELLNQIGIRFKVINPEIEEKSTHPDPRRRAMKNALAKAKSVSSQVDTGIILAADTLVYIEGEILGKPSSLPDAEMMIKKLSGRVHKVFTGVALIEKDSGKTITDFEETMVYVRNMNQDEINEFLSYGETLDKAGAYSVQGLGPLYVDRFVGSFYNVLGLPLILVKQMFEEIDVNLNDLLYGK